eukprot:tig00001604_g9412.t1
MGFKTPGETYAALEKAGAAKCHDLPWHRTFTQGFLAGLYIGFGATSAIMVGGGFWVKSSQEDDGVDPAIPRMLFAAVFPVGIMLVTWSGAELLTGNMMVDVLDLVHRCSWKTLGGVLKNWTISWLGNLCGSLFCSYVFAYHSGLFAAQPWLKFVHGIAENRAALYWYQIFVRAIACNTLVRRSGAGGGGQCMAVFMATSAEDAIGKWFCLWFPIFTFANSGFEHSVANMFLIPTSILYGAKVSWGYAFSNFMVVTLGNLIGAVVLCDFFFWFGFGRVYFRGNPLAPSAPGRGRQSERAGDKKLRNRSVDHLPRDRIVMTDFVSLTAGARPTLGDRHHAGLPMATDREVTAICLDECGVQEEGGECGCPPGGAGPYVRATASSVACSNCCRYQKRYVRKDGSVVRVWVEGMVRRSMDGRPERLEAHVHPPERPDLRGSVVVSLDGAGHTGVIESADPAFCDLLGYSPDELRQRPLTAVTHPDDALVSDNCIGRAVAEEAEALLGSETSTVARSTPSRFARSSIDTPAFAAAV